MFARAAKEIRTLLPPAGLVLAATGVSAIAASPSLNHQVHLFAEQSGAVAFVVGIPLLAAWSLGSEFQQRTLGLLLAQPVSRSRLWLEKWLPAALLVSIIVAIQVSISDARPFGPQFTLSTRLLLVAAVVASAPLWTLLARSTVGSVAFAGGSICILELAASFVAYQFAPEGAERVVFARTPVLDTLRVVYIVTTFAAGWWLFTRYEVAALDRAVGPRADPGSGRRWAFARYRSAGALRNLAVTEMHLHRSTWLASAGWMVCWLMAILVVQLLRPSNAVVDATFGVLFVFYVLVAIVLTGTMSLSEDSTFGMHAWRLTLPIPARTQWLMKLAATATVGAIVLVALPLAMGSLVAVVTGASELTFPPFVNARGVVATMCGVVLCFWGAALFGHAVRAVIAAGVMLVALVITFSTVARLSYQVEVFDGLLTALMVQWQVPPEFFGGAAFSRFGDVFLMTVLVTAAVVALVQSLHAFRRIHIDRQFRVVRMGTLVAVVAATGFALTSYSDAVVRLHRSAPASEVRTALRSVLAATPPAGTVAVAVEEVYRTGTLSPRARRWLAGSSVTAERGGRDRGDRIYLVRIQFPNQRYTRFFVRVPESPPQR